MVKEPEMIERLSLFFTDFHFFLRASQVMLEEGNGTPLQYSCLENPMDGGAW